MAGRFRAIAAGAHVAPAAQAVLGAIQKHPMATRIGAAAHPGQLLVHQCIGRRFHDGNHEAGEGIAGGYEGARVATGRHRIEATRAGAATEHTVDLDHRVFTHPLGHLTLLGQYTQRGTHPSRIDQRGRRRGRLQDSAAADTGGAFIVDGALSLRPDEQCLEVAQQIPPRRLRGGVGVDEVEPESRARCHGSRWTVARVSHRRAGPPRVGDGGGSFLESAELGYLGTWLQASGLTDLVGVRPLESHFTSGRMMSFPYTRVVVGSSNPVKVAAVRAVLARLLPASGVAALTVFGAEVPSGVPAQPLGDDETQRGARQRAQGALAVSDAALAVGLEGGVVVLPDGRMRTCAWAVVIDRTGREGLGGSLSMPLPEIVAARIRAGEELGHAMDAVARVVGTKHGCGAVGILTAGLIDRQGAYEPMVAYALAPWLAPDFYEPVAGSAGGDGR